VIKCTHCGTSVPNHSRVCPVCGNLPHKDVERTVETPDEAPSQAELKARLERKYGTNAERAAKRAKQQEEAAKREADQIAKEPARRQAEQAQFASATDQPHATGQPRAYSPQYQPYYPQPTFTIRSGMLVWSIFCIFFFAPLGIAGLVLTVNAKNARTQAEFDNSMKTAQICNLIATVLFVVMFYLLMAIACAGVVMDELYYYW
jgi:uncharacterized Zn finger protein (UPF0148 family)